MKTSMRLSSLFILSLLLISNVSAAPTLSTVDYQVFSQNEGSTQLYDHTITQVGSDELIQAGFLKLILPDSLAIIFDESRTQQEFTIYGTAVDNGRLSSDPEIQFSTDDKELWIPILEDFEAGEYLVLTRIYVEGFNSASSQSDSIEIQVNDAGLYESNHYLSINSSTNSDNNEPEAPSNIQVEATEEGVYLTWDDPSDLDLQTVEILRGLSPLPVSGTSYASVAAGEESFLDSNLEEGDEVTYILRSSDGRNFSDNSEEFTLTFTVPEESTDVPTEEISDEDADEDTPTDEVPADEDDDFYAIVFTDLEGHWGEDAIYSLAEAGIVSGNPDGSFRPDASLNRAEAAALIYRVWNYFPHTEEAYELEELFSDVKEEDWYFSPIMNMEVRGILNGNPDGTFEPAESINRAEFLQMTMKLYTHINNLQVEAEGMPSFFDDVTESDWFSLAVTYGAENGWVSGYDCDGEACFKPSQEISRAEAVQVLLNAFY